MKLYVGVENFGKIKKAEINISNFTIFVGNNNSGKTFMMQLIYGILESLKDFRSNVDICEYEIGKTYKLKDEVAELQNEINRYLERNKEKIVNQIFHHRMNIGRLYVKIETNNNCFQVAFSTEKKYVEKRISDDTVYVNEEHEQLRVDITMKAEESNESISNTKIVFANKVDSNTVWEYIYERMMWLIIDSNDIRQKDDLFIPASRTGMLLLYKYFFAEKEENDRRGIIKFQDKRGNELGLSEPVYDFLQFLLRYTPKQDLRQDNKNVLEFIQQYLLDGEIRQIGDETMYIPKGSDIQLPLYLASSMINELAPLIKVLTGVRQYKRIFYDEIETCLHPLKQGEMARTLFRMNNIGYKMIISTHSDTMASKINNLLLLSKVEEPPKKKGEKLKNMKLSEEDLLKTDEFHVYQFVNLPDGTSEVSELEFRKTPPTGYDFRLFMDSVNELYEETSTVMGD